MRLDIVPSFVTANEMAELNRWTEQGVENKWLDMGRSVCGATDLRLNTRMYGHRFVYPKIAHEIFQRIRDHLGFVDTEIIKRHGRDGIVVSYTKVGGDVFKHKDNSKHGFSALRCNIITQAADCGGKLFVDGKQVDVKAGDLHCYLTSEYEHYVTEVEGNSPRIIWMFGFSIEKEMWEKDELS
jgi:hypothetical protein